MRNIYVFSIVYNYKRIFKEKIGFLLKILKNVGRNVDFYSET